MDLSRSKYLNTLQLKLIAACAMFIDHSMYTFYPYVYKLRTIGRLAFPIFAFLVAVGYQKTKDLTLYMGRMLLFALIAQFPYERMINLPGINPNVIFTLFFGLTAILAIEKGSPFLKFTVPVLLMLGAELMAFDHSAYGVLMVIALFYAKESKLLTAIWIFVLTILFSLQYLYLGGLSNPGWYIVLFYLSTIPLINLYNGRKGLSNSFTRWFFYVFYPAHIMLLVILKSVL
ncbi:MAG: hypothetical protein JXN10_04690 [Clostridia bacterium]|nr:hypothetical protein [Clostridia bacterium]MBN2882803.1 hypothetical protein [Clostridia bacterium]